MSRGSLPQMPGDDLPDGLLQRLGGQPPAGRISAARDQAVGDIVGKAPSAPRGMGRGQMIAGLVAQFANQDPGLGGGWTAPPGSRA